MVTAGQAERIHASPAVWVVLVFGSVQAVADTLGIARGSVHGWMERGRIPAKVQPRILAIAEAQGLPVTPRDLILGREADVEYRQVCGHMVPQLPS